MERSETIGDLVTALAKAQMEFAPALKENEGKIQGTSKTGNAYEYSYKYADLASCLSAVRPALSKHAIAFLQFPSVDLEHQTVSVMTALHHGEQFISQTFEAPAAGRSGFNVQSIGAATTYLRRYGLQALCGLASEDDDGNSVATENKPIAKKQPAPAKTAPAHASQEPGMYDEPDPKPAPKKTGPTEDDFKMWQEAYQECESIDDWNKLIVPMMKERFDHPQYGRQFIIASAEEAKRRGYIGDRASGAYKVSGSTPPRYRAKAEPTTDDYEQGYAERQAAS